MSIDGRNNFDITTTSRTYTVLEVLEIMEHDNQITHRFGYICRWVSVRTGKEVIFGIPNPCSRPENTKP